MRRERLLMAGRYFIDIFINEQRSNLYLEIRSPTQLSPVLFDLTLGIRTTISFHIHLLVNLSFHPIVSESLGLALNAFRMRGQHRTNSNLLILVPT